jgi:phage baseplate assembly protein V
MKIGIVSAIDPVKCAARVQFPDNDDVISYWLPVVQPKTLKDHFYYMPDVGEQVVCLLDDNGESGVILGAIYSQADAAPVNNPDKWHVTFEDGTILEYDRKEHKLFADVKGDIEVKATGKADVTIDGKTTWISKGTIVHDGGSGKIKGNVQGDCICPYTRKPHSMISSNVKSSL